MAFLGEVEIQRATAASPGRLKVFHDVLEQWQRSKDTDLLPVKRHTVREKRGVGQLWMQYFSLGSIPYS